MATNHCAGCDQPKTAKHRARNGSDGYWCDGCLKRFQTLGHPEPPTCKADGCTTTVNVVRTGLDVCQAHRECAVCGTMGAPSKSPDSQWPGYWCSKCAVRYSRTGDPNTVRLIVGRTADQRFDDLVNPQNPVTGCMHWKGHIAPRTGHGRFNNGEGDRSYFAHKYALERHLNRKLTGDEQALHWCDNPPCVNPEHLYVGTNGQNMLDRAERGTDPAYGRRLGDAELEVIRAKDADGMARTRIAGEHGISTERLRKIVNRVSPYADR